MEVKRRIGKVGRYHLALFLLPFLSLLFYGWWKAPELNQRADNPQRFAPVHRRGKIVDRNARPIALNIDQKRRYPLGEHAGSLVGYQLQGRNHTGLEAALQGRLSPPLPAASLSSALTQDREVSNGSRDRLTGPDVTLTLDANLQTELYKAIQPLAGAIVVGDREGRILAAVSSPSFDPELVEQNWRKLRADPRSPFIERVGSGLYPVVLPAGESILSKEHSEHPWLTDEPFPEYPLASSAVWIEDRLFLTPLMLLQLGYEWSNPSLPVTPGLVVEGNNQTAAAPTESQPPNSLQIDNLLVWPLSGPPFRASPEFLSMIGSDGDDLFFAIVLEEKSAKSEAVLRNSILRVLSGEPVNAREPQQGSTPNKL